MKTALMIAIVVVTSSAGDVLLARGMKTVGEISRKKPLRVLTVARRILVNQHLLLGVFCMTVSFVAFLAALSWAALSLVLPATSLCYVISTLGAKYVLRERISPLRWAGTVLVCMGVALISLP